MISIIESNQRKERPDTPISSTLLQQDPLAIPSFGPAKPGHLLAGLALSIFLLGTASLPAANSDKKLQFDPARPLLSLHTPTRQNPLEDLASVLTASVAGESTEKRKPIVVYIHGRGNEPSKSFVDRIFVKGRVIEKLERFGVRVIGFNWDSAPRNRCERPIKRANTATPALHQLINKLREHRSNHPEFWQDRPLTLLTHSMGAFVLLNLDHRQLQGTPVFDRIVVSAADSPAADSENWLTSPAWKEAYVLTNPSDRILEKSVKCEHSGKNASEPQRLGLASPSTMQSFNKPTITLVQMPAATGRRHRYVTPGADANMHRKSLVAWLFTGQRKPDISAWKVRGNSSWIVIPEDNGKCGPTTRCDDGDDNGE